ncbi:hypothetical protein [Tabrizicola thermarum]|uniref:hypothetical protein n=1 Tax=Tabrizicola thermarum TaxID=2670345 RepID=UPI000FFBB9E1|nr:hypothetical protein [Tabrizicola thermarum]
MTATTLSAPNAFGRLVRAIPIIGRVIREVEREVDTIYYLIAILVTGLVLAIKTWGLAALVLTALALVPVMFVLLVILARP